MIFDTIESVLKQPLDSANQKSFRDTLAKCKYAKLENESSRELRLELGIENGQISDKKEKIIKHSSDSLSPKTPSSEKNNSFQKLAEEAKDGQSNESGTESNFSHFFLKDFLLSPEDKKYIETQDIIRRRSYADKKKELDKKISKKTHQEPESLTKLKNQQKLFEQETSFSKKEKEKQAEPTAEPPHVEPLIQRNQEKEKYERDIKEIKNSLQLILDKLKFINQKIDSSEFREAFNKSIKETIQNSIQEIGNIFSVGDAKNVTFLKDFVDKCTNKAKELEQKVEKEISEKKRLMEVEAIKKKLEEQERAKKMELVKKLTEEIYKNKTILSDLKASNQNKDIELEKKANFIQNISNESLMNQANHLKNFLRSQINQIDDYLSQIDKYLSQSFIDSLNQDIYNLTLKQMEENVQKFRLQSSQSQTQVEKLETQIQKSLSELVEAKKIKDQLEAEKQRLKEAKELEAKLAEKALQEKLQKEAEIKKREKEEEEKKKKDSYNQIKNVDENNKAGINNLTYEIYKKVEKLFEQTRAESENALNAKEFKIYKFELQKAINFPLNSLLGSENNGANFRDKIKTLLRLLSGQSCKVTSTITVDASKHPKAIDFCLVYLARKIVEKGEETVASRPETAFEYVQVIIEIMKTKIEFETIIMGQLQEKCPYIVPYYKPRISSQTDEQYYESLGYKLIDGKIEEDVHFFKRMNGVFYLYFTLLLSANSNYFSAKRAWQWLADVLNMAPRPNITAEMLTIFFKCCGHSMQKIYGKQFIKLVNCFQNDFLKLIQSISTEKQSNAPVGRLVNVCEHFRKYGQFNEWKKAM